MFKYITVNMVDLIQTLMALYPGKAWTVDGDSYRGIRWGDDMEESERPTEEFLELKRQELNVAQQWKELRQERNKRITETDFLATIDYPHASEGVKQTWMDYRQALRDLPANTEDPSDPTWPQEPTD
jgi:hypothetical protein